MKILLRTSLLALIICPFLVFASDTQTIEVVIDDTAVSVTAPQGFHEISSISVETRELAESLTPQTNDLLAVFLSEEDLGILMKGDSPNMEQHLLLQTAKEMASMNVSQSQFGYLSDLIKEQHRELLEKVHGDSNQLLGDAFAKIGDDIGIALDASVGNMVPLGVFLDQPNAVGYATLSKYQFEVDSESVEQVVVMGLSNILVRGKVLFAYVYRNFESQADIDWVRSVSSAWANSIIDSNRTSKESVGRNHGAAQTDSSNWYRVAEKGLVGLMLGGLLALFFGATSVLKKVFSKGKK